MQLPWKDAYLGWVLGSGAFIEWVKAMVRGQPSRERRRESRPMLSVPLSRITEVACAYYQIEPAELSQRGSRHPARAVFVYLVKSHALATNAERAAVLGLSRAESVPNLTRRFRDRLSTDAKIRKQLRDLEEVLDRL
jgi:hypothetical protein